jgi:RES domain-containing protein
VAPLPQDLYQAIDGLGSVIWSGLAYRHTAPQRPALSGAGASAFGGRWNAAGTPTIYLAEPEDACIAEFVRMAQGQGRGVQSFLPRDLHTVAVRGLIALDLGPETARASVGLSMADIESVDRTLCQQIGEAAQFLDLQAVIAPSATGVGIVIAVYERRLNRDQLTVTATRPISGHL